MNFKKNLFTLLFFTYLFFLSFPIQAKDNYPYSSIGDGKQGVSVALTLVDGISTDPDGNVFIDYGMGLGPFILGYSDEDVNQAVKEQLDRLSEMKENRNKDEVQKSLINLTISCV